ncbi:MAG: hypothetical protein RLZZ623_999 [Actinomycetota bacterium]
MQLVGRFDPRFSVPARLDIGSPDLGGSDLGGLDLGGRELDDRSINDDHRRTGGRTHPADV